MLREALEATGIAPNKAAALLGINPEIFQGWISGQRPIPYSFLTLLSTVIGIDLSKITKRKLRSAEIAEVTPAIWYRFREPNLVDQDRECVFLIRQLGYFIHELEEVSETKLVGWNSLFQEIRNYVDKQAPPRVQGRQAAQMFRDISSLSSGANGIGDVIRGSLRSIGIVVFESPLTESKLEGCCFLVGGQNSERPCVFANSHHSTWFRRNIVIAHELAHAIFDAEAAGAMLDFHDTQDGENISEERADAFALELMIPTKVLLHIAQKHGIKWDQLHAQNLAMLVAEIQVEKKAVLNAALFADVISIEQYQQYLCLDIGKILPGLTDRALTAGQYIEKIGGHDAGWLGKRNTTIPSRGLRLPSLYVSKVVEAFQYCQISRGKAAEMLMIDKDTFIERFGDLEEPFGESLDS